MTEALWSDVQPGSHSAPLLPEREGSETVVGRHGAGWITQLQGVPTAPEEEGCRV